MYEDQRHKRQNNNTVPRVFVEITPKYQIQFSHMNTSVHIPLMSVESADIYWALRRKETTIPESSVVIRFNRLPLSAVVIAVFVAVYWD
jgi:hypothetical protein